VVAVSVATTRTTSAFTPPRVGALVSKKTRPRVPRIDLALAATQPKPTQQQQQQQPNKKDDASLRDAIHSLLETEASPSSEGSPSSPDDDTIREENDSSFLKRHVATDALSALLNSQAGPDAPDDALRYVSSEMGVKQLIGEPIDDAAVATAILVERTLDTVEDIALHLRRFSLAHLWDSYHSSNNNNSRQSSSAKPDEQPQDNRKTVVVLGSGWGAHALMKVVDTQKVKLIVVSPTVSVERGRAVGAQCFNSAVRFFPDWAGPHTILLHACTTIHTTLSLLPHALAMTASESLCTYKASAAICVKVLRIYSSRNFLTPIIPTSFPLVLRQVFTPMLASASVGTVEYRSMTESVRDANPMMEDFVQGKATDIDLQAKQVTVQLNSLLPDLELGEPPVITIDYDHLVVAVGNQVYDANVPGARENCLRLKTSDDARRLRTCVCEAFEYASRPGLTDEERARRVTFVVAGGGPTGVELAGELSDFCHDMTIGRKAPYRKLANYAQVILVHGGSELLPQFDAELRPEARRALEKRGVKVVLNTRVTKVEHESVTMSTKVLDSNGKPTGERVENNQAKGLAVWCAGIAPVPFVEALLSKLPDEARGQGGRVAVDRWLRPPMPSPNLTGSIIVLGDAASVPSRRQSTEVLPQTAQVAGQQGAYVARLLTRGYNLTEVVPSLPCAKDQSKMCTDPSLALWLMFRNLERAPGFSFLNLGLLAYLGGGKALSQVQIGDVPVFSYAGSIAFVLWRSVYLVKQVATRNRLLVTVDWVKSAMFGRDTTRL
jgi:NADH dehydrogenase